MGRTLSLVPPFFLALAIMFLPEMKARGHNTVLRGWLSDEGCASRRANGGLTLAQIPIAPRSASAKARESSWSTQTTSAY